MSLFNHLLHCHSPRSYSVAKSFRFARQINLRPKRWPARLAHHKLPIPSFQSTVVIIFDHFRVSYQAGSFPTFTFSNPFIFTLKLNHLQAQGSGTQKPSAEKGSSPQLAPFFRKVGRLRANFQSPSLLFPANLLLNSALSL